MSALTTDLFAGQIDRLYNDFHLQDFPQRHFPPDQLQAVIERLALNSSGLLTVSDLGMSFEGRAIRLISGGGGATPVLLWSQMHGDESTATAAIIDILNYLIRSRVEEATQRLLGSLTLHFLPMLNPDGAARVQRRTAQGIDMNRDALVLATPEARILKKLQHELNPRFGFNLHDQELSTVGATKDLTAIALLAPAYDAGKSDNEVRLRAKHVASVFASTMAQFIPAKTARYDDTFEPRAFGDNFQKWGTSTVLVESGHATNDPRKDLIRKLNVVGMLSSLYSIATDEYRTSDISVFEDLPFNGKKAYDVIVRNVTIDYGEGRTAEMDIGISCQVDTHSEQPPRIVDLGDLSTLTALKIIDGRSSRIPTERLILGEATDLKMFAAT
jgi:hypothetical protein